MDMIMNDMRSDLSIIPEHLDGVKNIIQAFAVFPPYNGTGGMF